MLHYCLIMPLLLGHPQRHLGIILDNQLKFDNHLKMVSGKISQTIGLLRKWQYLLPRAALIIIDKAFIRPQLDYGDILYDQAYNMSFQRKLESIRSNACLAIIGAIRGTSKEKPCQELGLESLQLRRWYRKLGIFTNLTRNADNIPLFNFKHKLYKNSFFLSTIIEWNNLDSNLPNSEHFGIFKNNILKFIKPKPSSFFNCCNLKGIKLITQLRLQLSHLREHKFPKLFKSTL